MTHLDHGHIYGQKNGLRDAGATLKCVCDPDPARFAAFVQTYPGVVVVESLEQILLDPDIKLVCAASPGKGNSARLVFR